MTRKSTIFRILTLCVFLQSGCSSLRDGGDQASFSYGTQLSQKVQLTQSGAVKPKIYVDVRNQSTKSNFDIQRDLKHAMIAKGYILAKNSDDADYQLVADVRTAGNMAMRDAENALAVGYGESVPIGGVGAFFAKGRVSDKSIVGSLMDTTMDSFSSAFIKHDVYSVITDLNILERKGLAKNLKKIGQLKEKGDWHQYRTRMVSSAKSMNMDFDRAESQLRTEMIQSISALF